MDNNNKNYNARPNVKACQTDCGRKSTDLQANKPWPKNTRHRENSSAPRNESHRNSKQNSSKNRANYDKRPRPRGGGGGNSTGGSSVGSSFSDNGNGNSFGGDGYEESAFDAACATENVSTTSTGLATDLVPGASGAVAKKVQLNYEKHSVYMVGSKKQNLNHLLNFHYQPRESHYAIAHNVFGQRNHNSAGASNGKKHKYNKEQFLQANFQFVIKSSAKPRLTASPDTLIDWDLIEQINIQTTEEPQCPICLYPPIAAKLTRCGHAYCWPCILHYLALSDKTWRKCPICYEAIHTADLKSTTIVQQRPIGVGDQITFNLMRRKKDSMFIEKFSAVTPSVERFPEFSSNQEAKLFSKFVIARRADILEIIEREYAELTLDEDSSCPEFVFIQQALDLLKERRQHLGNMKPAIEEPELAEEQEQTNDIVVEEAVPLANIDETTALDDIKTTPLTPSQLSLDGLPQSNAAKYYYFYQSEDGQNIYLHPLNVKMLQACYGTLDHAPVTLTARILQKEQLQMDEEHRRKFTCLAHLPLTCQFAVVEVDLQAPTVTESILRLFKDDLLFRKKERQRRDREERKREKKIDEINDRQMGKLIASAAHLNLSSALEFPTCGFEESLPTTDNSNTVEIRSQPVAAPHASYSTIAVTGGSPKKELWPTLASPTMAQSPIAWGKNAMTPTTAATNNHKIANEQQLLVDCDSGDDGFTAPKVNNLSDVLAEAMSQRKQKESKLAAGAANGKKGKRGKKMVPVFSTGMNFGGN